MKAKETQFKFNISLSVLNHLGRNLYRNFITTLGEAISNSWDADANNVWIEIDRERRRMVIKDDGIGMTTDDFQNKFLEIGYSKRSNGQTITSNKKRPFIGQKGIGKLALLSCSKKVHIASKTKRGTIIGGVIDNTELDKAISNGKNSDQYKLDTIDKNINDYFNDINSGTVIIFENIIPNITNTIDYIKKAVALFFRFSLIDNFNIFINNTQITIQELKELADTTQFIWNINNFNNDPYLHSLDKLDENIAVSSELDIKGFIATTKNYQDVKIRGTDEKATLDLFVNGRLREKDILKHIPSARLVENYTYGQIHFDALDNGTIVDNVFTSSREGILTDNKDFVKFIKQFSEIYKQVIREWDIYRRKHHNDGDPADTTITIKERKAEELFNQEMKDIFTSSTTQKSIIIKNGEVEKWGNALTNDARFNIPCYTECFITENLLRKYIEFTKCTLSDEAKIEAVKWKTNEIETKNIANISYNIRQSTDDIYYLDMDALSNFVDKAKDKSAGISRSAKVYRPIRNAVGHTALLTDIAKQNLNTEFQNIKARLQQVLDEFQKKDRKRQ
jgi:hypothetical protein